MWRWTFRYDGPGPAAALPHFDTASTKRCNSSMSVFNRTSSIEQAKPAVSMLESTVFATQSGCPYGSKLNPGGGLSSLPFFAAGWQALLPAGRFASAPDMMVASAPDMMVNFFV